MSPCSPVIDVGISNTLWTTTIADSTVYTCRIYSWTSSRSGSVAFTMQFRHDPGYWQLDDVSIFGGGYEMLVNGGFEKGSLSPWVRTTPNGTCAGSPAGVTNSMGIARTGAFGLRDGSYKCFDQVAQSFTAKKNQTYEISFWTKSSLVSSSGIYAHIFMN